MMTVMQLNELRDKANRLALIDSRDLKAAIAEIDELRQERAEAIAMLKAKLYPDAK